MQAPSYLCFMLKVIQQCTRGDGLLVAILSQNPLKLALLQVARRRVMVRARCEQGESFAFWQE